MNKVFCKTPDTLNIADGTEEGQISDVMVLRSAAGFYIGTAYWDKELHGVWLPNERLSFGYYRTYEEARTVMTEFPF